MRPSKEQINHVEAKHNKPVIARYRIDGKLVEAWIINGDLVDERPVKGLRPANEV